VLVLRLGSLASLCPSPFLRTDTSVFPWMISMSAKTSLSCYWEPTTSPSPNGPQNWDNL